MALGVYTKLSVMLGVNIPDDISVVSFDDVDINRFLTPTLSSVYMNTEEMGKTAVRLAKESNHGGYSNSAYDHLPQSVKYP